MGTPEPLSNIPVWPVPINSTFRPRSFNRCVISQPVVILPESQSVPTMSNTGMVRFCHDPFGKFGGFGGRLKSVKVTLYSFAILANSGSS